MLPVDNQCNMTMMPVEILVEDGLTLSSKRFARRARVRPALAHADGQGLDIPGSSLNTLVE